MFISVSTVDAILLEDSLEGKGGSKKVREKKKMKMGNKGLKICLSSGINAIQFEWAQSEAAPQQEY